MDGSAAAAAAMAAAMSVAAKVPVPTQVFTPDDYDRFDQGLIKYAMDPNPHIYIKNGWELKCARFIVRNHMDRLWRNAPRHTWDNSKVPKHCNVQAWHAVELLLDICGPKTTS